MTELKRVDVGQPLKTPDGWGLALRRHEYKEGPDGWVVRFVDASERWYPDDSLQLMDSAPAKVSPASTVSAVKAAVEEVISKLPGNNACQWEDGAKTALFRVIHYVERSTDMGKSQQARDSEGWEFLPSDLRTHLGDFKEAVAQMVVLGDPDGYWAHQLKTVERVESMLQSGRS
jgi:hypothetical protein